MGFGINKFKCSCGHEFNSMWNSVTMEFGSDICPNCGKKAKFIKIMTNKELIKQESMEDTNSFFRPLIWLYKQDGCWLFMAYVIAFMLLYSITLLIYRII